MTSEDVRRKWREQQSELPPGKWPVHWLTLPGVVRDPLGRIVGTRGAMVTDCGMKLDQVALRELAGNADDVTCGDCLSAGAAPEVEAALALVRGTYHALPSKQPAEPGRAA